MRDLYKRRDEFKLQERENFLLLLGSTVTFSGLCGLIGHVLGPASKFPRYAGLAGAVAGTIPLLPVWYHLYTQVDSVSKSEVMNLFNSLEPATIESEQAFVDALNANTTLIPAFRAAYWLLIKSGE